MGGGRAKALSDLGRGTGGSGDSRGGAKSPEAGVLLPPSRVGSKNTWGKRSREGVSRAGSPGLAQRPEKIRQSWPLGKQVSPPEKEGEGHGEREQGHEEGGSPGRGGARLASAQHPGSRGNRGPTPRARGTASGRARRAL